MQGEKKGEGHDVGSGTAKGGSVPLRRWDDWERSRLRKQRRDEKRRREMARAFPNGYLKDNNGYLRADMRSQYTDGSDTVSMTSSEEDQWGEQIGGYNEHSAQYPPPPPGLLVPSDEIIRSAETVDEGTMAAMLESGFNDRPSSYSNSSSSRSRGSSTAWSSGGSSGQQQQQQYQHHQRYQLMDGPVSPHSGPPSPAHFPLRTPMNGYDTSAATHGRAPQQIQVPSHHLQSPISPIRPVAASSSAVDWTTHVKKRSVGGGPQRYGPLGPLDPNN